MPLKGENNKDLENSDSGGGLGYEVAATYAAISGSTDSRYIRVEADENNGGLKALYLYTNGIGIEFLQLIA